MRLGVIADTHIPDRALDLPKPLIKDLKKTDLIIHAGDFTSIEFYLRLRKIKDVLGVLGNIDPPQIGEYVKNKETLSIGRFRIGIMHGFGMADSVLNNVKKTFPSNFDLVIYGHSHSPCKEQTGKTLYFNPGSPTDTLFAPYNSYGIIEIDKTIEAKIIKL